MSKNAKFLCVLVWIASFCISSRPLSAQRAAPPRGAEKPAWEALTAMGAIVGYYAESPLKSGPHFTSVKLDANCGDKALVQVKAFTELRELATTAHIERGFLSLENVHVTNAGLAN